MRSVRESSPPPTRPAKPRPARRRSRPKRAVQSTAQIERAWAYEVAHRASTADLTPIVGHNLKRLRSQRGLSLEKMAQASGVSRAMLGQIELAQSTPTINVLWKISAALDVPLSALISDRPTGGTTLLTAEHAKILTSHDGKYSSRALFPFDVPRKVEFYELRLKPEGLEQAEPHPPGTTENLVVSEGSVEITVEDKPYRLNPGDAILFEADVRHAYRNAGESEAVMYLVMTYTDAVG